LKSPPSYKQETKMQHAKSIAIVQIPLIDTDNFQRRISRERFCLSRHELCRFLDWPARLLHGSKCLYVITVSKCCVYALSVHFGVICSVASDVLEVVLDIPFQSVTLSPKQPLFSNIHFSFPGITTAFCPFCQSAYNRSYADSRDCTLCDCCFTCHSACNSSLGCCPMPLEYFTRMQIRTKYGMIVRWCAGR
jgi:hypothetical protein